MIASPVPKEAIPDLAARVDSPEMFEVLRHIQHAGFVQNSKSLDRQTFDLLQRLADLGLVDRGYNNGLTDQPPTIWVSNRNGSRVLGCLLTKSSFVPYYEIPSTELAAWLEEQGPDSWWNVDGDPLLTGRLSFPCPADELAAALRRLDRRLLVLAKPGAAEAKGQCIGKDRLNDLVGRLSENLHLVNEREMPPWVEDRVLLLCWKGSPHEWLLVEDTETAKQMRSDEASEAK